MALRHREACRHSGKIAVRPGRRRPGRRLYCDRAGAVLIEFAVLTPVLLLFTFGIISYSWWYFLANGVQHAANDGARAAIAGLDSGERQALAIGKATDNLRAVGRYDMQQARVAVVEQANRLTVTVTYDASGIATLRLPFVPAPPTRIVQRATILLGGL